VQECSSAVVQECSEGVQWSEVVQWNEAVQWSAVVSSAVKCRAVK
jgi:hypothetical protein